MIFRQLFDHESFSFSYLLGDAASGEAILVDPVLEQLGTYLRLLTELNLDLKIAVDTHCHADHITAMGELRSISGCETLVGKPSPIACASRQLADGELFGCRGIELEAMHTPGHTDDSYCYYLGEKGLLLSGDTLLIRGTGRTDFQNGSSEALYKSLFERVLYLPRETKLFPGHDYKGWTQSTLAEEIDHNPRLQVSCWQELATMLDELKLENPKLMDIAVAANQQCGNSFGALSS